METRSEYVESKDYPAYELFQEVYKLAVDNYSTLIDEENGLLEYDDVVKLVYDLNLVNKN